MLYERKRTIGFEKGGVAIGPCPKLEQTVSQKYLQKGEELVVSHSNDRIEVVQCIKVKDSWYPKGSNNRVDSGRTTF